MGALVDDRLLLHVLAGSPPAGLPKTGIYTTGAWYYRLSRAVHDLRLAGSLSRAFQEQSPKQRAALADALVDLPEWVGMLGWRQVVPVMSLLAPEWRLNMLAAEAVAAAAVAGVGIRVSVDNPSIATAAAELGIDYAVLPPA